MANGVHLLTGHQDSAHISAADEAAFYAALLSGQNSIVADSKNLSLLVNPTAGTVTLEACVALFSGRVVRITGTTASYTKPASSTTSKHVQVGILYEKDEDTTEDCSLAAYTSAEYTGTPTTLPDVEEAPSASTIGAETDAAFFPLFDFVVSSTAYSTPTHIYAACGTFGGIVDRVATLEAWKTEKDTTDSLLSGRVSTLETNASVVKKLTHTSSGYYTQAALVLVIVKSNDGYFTSFIAARYGNRSGTGATAMTYKLAGNGECFVTFPENDNYINLTVLSSYGQVYAVYEMKAV